MSVGADILVFDENRDLLLLAEVNAKEETDVVWAAEIRHDVAELRRGALPPYFVVVARDTTYIWSTREVDAPPEVQIPTGDLLGEYLRETKLNAREIMPSALELLVGLWLRDLTYGDARATRAIPSRLAEAAVNGRMEFANAA